MSLAAPKLQKDISKDGSNDIVLITVIRLQNDVPLLDAYTLTNCMVTAVEDVSATHRLESKWSVSREAITPLLERLRNCTDET